MDRVRGTLQYDSYQKSEIPWAESIPSHWTSKRLKYVASVNPTGDRAKKGEIVTFLPMDAVSQIGTIDNIRIGERSLHPSSLTEFKRHDVILAKITPCFENGKAAYLKDLKTEKGVGSTEFHVIRPDSRIMEPRFAYYLVSNADFRRYAERFMEGSAGQKRVTTPFLANMAFPIPDLSTQQRIVNFLDKNTAEIDEAIAKKQRLIALLKEQKAILINQAVTKGLNPNVPMRDSGVEWIGAIPGHWQVKQIKFFTELQSGITLGKSYSGRNLVRYPYLRVANVQYGYFKLDDIAELALPKRIAQQYMVRAGDILVTEGGDIDKLGRGTVWNGEINNCLHQNHIFAVRVKGQIADANFVSYAMGADYGRRYFTHTANKTTNLASTNSTKLGNFPVVLAPRDEQDQVVSWLKGVESEFNNAMEVAAREAAALQELKACFVAEAVTGKLRI